MVSGSGWEKEMGFQTERAVKTKSPELRRAKAERSAKCLMDQGSGLGGAELERRMLSWVKVHF